jgi:hypothetical protein
MMLTLMLILPLGCLHDHYYPVVPRDTSPTTLDNINGLWKLDRNASHVFNVDFSDFFVYNLEAGSLAMEIDSFNRTLTFTMDNREPIISYFNPINIAALNPDLPGMFPINPNSIYLDIPDRDWIIELTLYNDPELGTRLYYTRPDIMVNDDHSIFVPANPLPVQPQPEAEPQPQPQASEGLDPSQYHFVY